MERKLAQATASGIVLLSAALLCCGCVTTTTKNGRQIPGEPGRASRFGKLKDSISGLASAVTPKDSADPIHWRWAAGIPQSVLKGEQLPAPVPQDAVAHFAPQADLSRIQLVSRMGHAPLSIGAVGDRRIRTQSDLNDAIERAALGSGEGSEQDNVVVELTSGPGATPVPARVSRNNLIALAHAGMVDGSQIRVVDDGNPWVIVRDDAVRCKLMLRKEHSSSLVHVVMSLKVCWGPPRKLPVALFVSSAGTPLSCLGVADVLEQLYNGDPQSQESRTERPVVAYHDVAEHDEFLTPVNYRELEAKIAADQRLASIRPYPAFAVVGGYAYPGPPVLGDARALSGFMLQPRVMSADEPEQVGWVVFDGSAAAGSEIFEVAVNLGRGPQRVVFRVPDAGL